MALRLAESYPQYLINNLFPAATFAHNNQRVFAKDSERVKRVLAHLIASGASQLKIVSDFDYTLTPFYVNAAEKKRGYGCHSIIENSHLFDENLRKKSMELAKYYFPIEIDLTVPPEEKAKYMLEWALHAHEVMVEAGLTHKDLTTIVEDGLKLRTIGVRPHVPDFIQFVKTHGLPMMIYSGGITEVLKDILSLACGDNNLFVHVEGFDHDIELHMSKSNSAIFDKLGGGESTKSTYCSNLSLGSRTPLEMTFEESLSLSQKSTAADGTVAVSETVAVTELEYSWDGIHVISNRCKFSEFEPHKLICFYEPALHILNKRSSYFKNTEYFFPDVVENSRGNVILMGDSLSDVYMIEGMAHNPEGSLKIGFINDEEKITDERLEIYLNTFDLVIVGDEAGLEVPLAILHSICGPSTTTTAAAATEGQ